MRRRETGRLSCPVSKSNSHPVPEMPENQSPSGASIPIYFNTDRELITKSLQTIGLVDPGKERVVRIKNTLDLAEVLVSEVYLPEVEKRDDLEIIEGPTEMNFDTDGDLA